MAKIGRPTKYSPLILKRTEKYLKTYKKLEEIIPSIEGLAYFLQIRRSTLYEWAKDEEKKEFSDIFEALLTLQGKVLLTGGLGGKMNPVISKLILSKHGYKEESKQEHTIDPDLQKLIEKANKILPE